MGLGLVWLCYHPGLSGAFLFDDFANLDELGNWGEIDSLDKFLRMLMGLSSNPARIVAYVSFLLDDYSWPSDPYLFKVHNVLFHLLAGLVLAWLAMRLAGIQGLSPGRAAAVGLLAAALWLLHPLQVSTVLYVVQRMAILAALFVLIGLLLYAAGRQHLAAGRLRRGFILMTAGIGLCMPLAYFSKENGALLPLFALLLDATVLRALGAPADAQRLYRLWRAVMLYLPIAVIVIWFVVNWNDNILAGYARRPFSFEQRMLTEGRVLWDYLFHILIPRAQTNGLYYDNFPVSTGWLSPWTTLPAWLGIIGLLFLAWRWRARRPVLALAIGFYFAGQLIESTVIALEIYFEHRNYLPSAMLGFAAAYYLVMHTPKRVAMAAGAAALALLAALTYARSSLWGDDDLLALVWAQRNPGSLRAQQQAAITWLKHGDPARAEAHVKAAIEAHPRRAILRVQYIGLRCATGRLAPADIAGTAKVLRTGILDSSLFRNLSNLIELQQQGRCPKLTTADLETLLQAALQHPLLITAPGIKQDLYYLLGQLYLREGRDREAWETLKTAYAVRPEVEAGLRISALLASHGAYEAALALLDRLSPDRMHVRGPAAKALTGWLDDYYRHEIQYLRETIQQDMIRDQTTRKQAP